MESSQFSRMNQYKFVIIYSYVPEYGKFAQKFLYGFEETPRFSNCLLSVKFSMLHIFIIKTHDDYL